MIYRPITDFAVDKPQTLRRDLQRLDQEIASGFRQLTSVPWTIRKVTADTTARFGEMLIVDSTGGSVVVTLPVVDANNAGRTLVIVRTSASNSVTVLPVGSDQINRATSLALAATVGVRARIEFDGVEYFA